MLHVVIDGVVNGREKTHFPMNISSLNKVSRNVFFVF